MSAAAANLTEPCAANIPGYTHHGNCSLLYSQASWTDILVFFLGNYIAHAATVISYPGQSIFTTVVSAAVALLFPSAGIFKAVHSISTLAVFAPTELQKAARAGALCMVVKLSDYKKVLGNDLWGLHMMLQVTDMEMSQFLTTHVSEEFNRVFRSVSSWPFGLPQMEEDPPQQAKHPAGIMAASICGMRQSLPPGYALITLPATIRCDPDPETSFSSLFKTLPPSERRMTLSYSHNFVKIAISIGQLLFGVSTLYRLRGDQLHRFGYAAFGLTVVPYMWMSFVNLVGNLILPQYPAKFLVGSKTLNDVCRDYSDFHITGTVAKITVAAENDIVNSPTNNHKSKTVAFAIYLGVAVFLAAVPVAIVGGLSHFDPAFSELYQRVWIMVWLAFGICMGPLVYFVLGSFILGFRNPLFRFLLRFPPVHCGIGIDFERINNKASIRGLFRRFVIEMIILTAIFCVPAIGGFVAVGQMIAQYGVCLEID